jgi:hypothetical protein
MANDVLSSFLQNYQGAQQQKQQNRLLDMREQAFAAEQQSAAKAASAEDQEQMFAQLQRKASLYGSAPDMLKPHIYGQIVDLAEGAGYAQKGQLPRELTPEVEPQFQQFIQSVAGLGQKDNTPSAIRELQMLQANPELAELDMKRRTAGFDRPQLIQTDQGYAWATPQGAAPLNYGSAAGEPSSNYQGLFAQIASRNGSAVTSGIRPVLPGVGAGANSQHPKGTAADFRTNGLPPERVQALMQDLQAQGFEVIDERDNRNGRGPHLHAELPPGGRRVMPAQKERASSDFERRLAMAQSMGATPDQLKQMVMGETGGGKPSATQIKLASTAKQKLIDLQALEQQLNRVEQTFGGLRGTYSAGLGGNLLPTEEGRRFDAAVSLLKGQVRKLTRTPGEGAMSDYESKLAELANPSRGEYENVTADQIEQLRALVQTTRQGYEALLQDAGGNSANLPGAQSQQEPDTSSGGWSIKVKP